MTDKTARAFQNDDCTIAFTGDIDAQHEQDIMHLLRQAEAFASRAFDRQTLWISWVDRFCNRLEKHGCERRSIIASPPSFITDSGQLDAVNLRVIGDHDQGALLSLSRRVLESLDIHRSSREFLKGGSCVPQSFSWQMVPCQMGAGARINVLVLAVHAACNEETRDYGLWNGRQREVVLRFKGAFYEFDPALYAPYRQCIKDQLEEAARREFARIAL